jgi:peptide/nickel transport system permease protein
MADLLPALIGGSIVIETIFGIPGMGQLSWEAVLNRDYPLIMAIFTLSAMLTLLGILLADFLYTIVDPRISYEKGLAA